MTTKHRVTYFYNNETGNYHYGDGHPMKPHRLALTNALVHAYGLDKYMNIYKSAPATDYDLLTFHTEDYISFLKRIRPDDGVSKEGLLGFKSSLATQSDSEFKRNLSNYYSRFNFAADCPVFDGMYDFCTMYTGGSLVAARHLSQFQVDIAINWSGGLHHAKRQEASGFCYVNDITIAAIELLKTFRRVLYIDIDVHHGDGVQEAFYATDRVMTLSFHKYGDGFFPGTGSLDEIGTGIGRLYAVNVPLNNGIDDASYLYMFKPVVSEVIYSYRPEVIILQCGADSLHGDRLGCFNLSIQAHGECIAYVKSFGLPLLVVGGGGYTIRNVSRCWTHETSILVDQALSNDLPETVYDAYFDPDRKLHPPASSLPRPMENENTRTHLDSLIARIKEQMRGLQGPPSVQMFEAPRILGPGEFQDILQVQDESHHNHPQLLYQIDTLFPNTDAPPSSSSVG